MIYILLLFGNLYFDQLRSNIEPRGISVGAGRKIMTTIRFTNHLRFAYVYMTRILVASYKRYRSITFHCKYFVARYIHACIHTSNSHLLLSVRAAACWWDRKKGASALGWKSTEEHKKRISKFAHILLGFTYHKFKNFSLVEALRHAHFIFTFVIYSSMCTQVCFKSDHFVIKLCFLFVSYRCPTTKATITIRVKLLGIVHPSPK